MPKEYRTIQEVAGPLMLVKGVEGVAYDELGEIELFSGEKRRCKVLEINEGNALVQLFENSTGINLEDLISIGAIGLIKAVNTFSPEKKIKLATYASRCIENEILMFLRKASSSRGELSIDEPLKMDWDGNELLLRDVLGTDPDTVHRDLEWEAEKQQLRRCIGGLNPRERKIICLRFGLEGGEEMTQKQVADEIGISQSYISRLEKRIMKKLKTAMEQ